MTKVAVKCVDTLQGTTDERALKRIRREIGILLRLRHPHIPVMIGTATTKTSMGTSLVTEFCRGGSAWQRIFIRKDMDRNAGIVISQQVTQAVTYMHGLGCWHRDLKPDNIFLLTRSLVEPVSKLGDFGLGRYDACSDGTVTPGVGTATYIAPEVHNVAYGSAADVYSLGLSIYELIVRARSFPPDEVIDFFLGGNGRLAGATLQDRASRRADVLTNEEYKLTLRRMAAQGVRPAARNADAVLGGLHAILATCCAAKPEDRCSAADVYAQLSVLAAAKVVANETY
jgi:serine/threonine protein kinase